ncbi:N-acetylmuramoyl-L-alanine amidase [Peribacillus sp. NPDC076916]
MFHTFTFLRRDAGHGGSDPGGIGNGLQEKNLTLKIATNIKSLVEDYKE